MQEIGFEESEEEVIPTSEIKEILGMWEKVSQFVEKKHPEKVATGRASDLFNDTCLTHFRNILRGRKKQTSRPVRISYLFLYILFLCNNKYLIFINTFLLFKTT